MQDARAGVRALVDLVGLGAGEPGRHDDLGFIQEHAEAQVVPVEAEPPGRGLGRRAEQHEVVAVLVHDPGRAHQLAQEVVDAHRRDGFRVALGAQRGFQQGQRGRPERRRDLV